MSSRRSNLGGIDATPTAETHEVRSARLLREICELVAVLSDRVDRLELNAESNRVKTSDRVSIG